MAHSTFKTSHGSVLSGQSNMYFSALLCLLSIIASADSVGDCISNYKELRENVFSRYKNKMELQNTFYPVNSLRPDTVVVTYKISSPDNPNPTSQNEEYIFRWSSAKAFTFIRPDLLALLSVTFMWSLVRKSLCGLIHFVKLRNSFQTQHLLVTFASQG